MIVNVISIMYAALVLTCLMFYTPKIRQIFYSKHRIEHKIAAVKRRISIIVPARNESEIVGDLFASIASQDYDKSFFAVNVVVDSADDPTVRLAESYGFKVFIVQGQRCKGDALDGYFKSESGQTLSSFDAFVIVDADAVLTCDYLTELNNALEHDGDIYLSRKRIKNFLGERRNRTIFSNCSALTYAQLDDLGNVYRTDHDMPLNMCGQGMMVRRKVIEKLGGWPYRTLTEDYEVKMECYLSHLKSVYYPYAIIYTEEPLGHGENFSRRMRWVTGFAQSDALYKKRIKDGIKSRGRASEGEREYLYGIIPPIIYLIATALTVLAGAGLSIYGAITRPLGWLYPLLLLILLPCAVTYAFLLVYAILCMVCMKDAFVDIPLAERIATVLFEPFYALEYVPIFIAGKIRARRGGDWKPMRRVRYGGSLRKRATRGGVSQSVNAPVAVENADMAEEING